MRFFTRAWCNGEYSGPAYERVTPAYWRHIREIAGQLPVVALRLAQEISLHDAQFREVTLEPARQWLALELRCGDLQSGYFDLDLRYLGVTLDKSTVDDLAAWVNDPHTEVLYDEVDLAGAEFEHRLLLWPQGELAIQFQDLELLREPVPAREFQVMGPRFKIAAS